MYFEPTVGVICENQYRDITTTETLATLCTVKFLLFVKVCVVEIILRFGTTLRKGSLMWSQEILNLNFKYIWCAIFSQNLTFTIMYIAKFVFPSFLENHTCEN